MVPGIVGLPTAKPELVFTDEQLLHLVTRHGFAILEHLAATAVRQKTIARQTKKGWQKGWTYMRYNQHVKLATVRALRRLGLVEFCCEGHGGRDLVRISRRGIEFLELVRGEEILA
jgi:hypothetical protein